VNQAEEVAAWAASGAMALCGRPDGPPLGPPRRLVAAAEQLGEQLRSLSARWGEPVEVDVLARLGERAAMSGFTRQGDRSCGGAARLLPTADGSWIAANLPRPDDWEATAAWLLLAGPLESGDWDEVAARVAASTADDLVDRAVLLGVPVSRLGEIPADPTTACAPAGDGRDRRARAAEALVVDLSALWAGPLAASVLRNAGARVVKVESTRRPDGARRGPTAFFDRLNAGKELVSLDLAHDAGRRELAVLVDRADVVVTASRSRALASLGLDPSGWVKSGGRPRVWLSVTGYGLTGPGADRVAFGDDAAVAGGLVVWDERGPCFCADAIADPLTGLVGAARVLDALVAGRSEVVDLSMAGVAAGFASPVGASAERR
jgi:hypothetical protein